MTQATSANTLAALLNNLTSPDYKVRRAAVTDLCENYPAQALQPLCALLTDPHAIVRSHVVKELGSLKNKAASGPLLQCLQDPSLRVRLQTFKALGRLKDTSAVLPIIACLTDPTIAIQLAAITALRALRDPRAIPALLALLSQDTQKPALLAVVNALGAMRAHQAVSVLLAFSEQKIDESALLVVVEALGNIGDETAIDRLLELAARWTTDQMVASAAIWSLATIGGNRVLSALLAFYRATEDDSKQYVIIRSLSQIKGVGGEPEAEVREILLQKLNNPDLQIVTRAVEALGNAFKDERAIQPLLDLLVPSNHWSLTVLVRKILARWGGPLVLAAILERYQRTADKDVHYLLLQCLGEVRRAKGQEREAVLTLLLQLLASPDSSTRRLAIEALGKTFKDERAVEPLLSLLDSGDSATIRFAIGTLGRLGDQRSIDPLLQLTGNVNYAYWAIGALGQFKERRVIKQLIALLFAPTPGEFSIQFELLRTLRKLADPQAAEPLRTYIANPANSYLGYAQQTLEILERARHQSDID